MNVSEDSSESKKEEGDGALGVAEKGKDKETQREKRGSRGGIWAESSVCLRMREGH